MLGRRRGGGGALISEGGAGAGAGAGGVSVNEDSMAAAANMSLANSETGSKRVYGVLAHTRAGTRMQSTCLHFYVWCGLPCTVRWCTTCAVRAS